MPKATITYDIDLDTEEYLFKFLASAKDFYLAVWNFDGTLRNTLKHNSLGKSDDFLEGVEFARESLHEYLSMYGVDLDIMS